MTINDIIKLNGRLPKKLIEVFIIGPLPNSIGPIIIFLGHRWLIKYSIDDYFKSTVNNFIEQTSFLDFKERLLKLSVDYEYT